MLGRRRRYWFNVSCLLGSCYSQQTQNICITFVKRRHKRYVFDAGPTLYKCFVLTGLNAAQQTRGSEPVLVCCWASVADGEPALDQHWVEVVFAWSVDKSFAPKRNKFRSIHHLYCPQDPFNNTNYKIH